MTPAFGTAAQVLYQYGYRMLHVDRLYQFAVKCFIMATEHGYVPDFILRRSIRYLLGLRKEMCGGKVEDQLKKKIQFIEEVKEMPIAINTAEANEQHYEVPTEYYLMCLGKNLKYSSCYYKTPYDTLNQAEHNMLAMTCQRANLEDGQDILELGCGWGSLSLFMAASYPNSRITSVSNSRTQREFIMRQCLERGITNLTVLTANMVDFTPPGTYDRVVSVEMFEHMKNYKALLHRVASWLRPGGQLFVHIFCHKNVPYHFEVAGEDDWMSRYFFTGGTMPSLDMFLFFQDDLRLANMWYISGTHYSRTLEAWLKKHDQRRADILPIMDDCYGRQQAFVWYMRWRIFYLACSELFNYDNGQEWGVGHYLFVKPHQ